MPELRCTIEKADMFDVSDAPSVREREPAMRAMRVASGRLISIRWNMSKVVSLVAVFLLFSTVNAVPGGYGPIARTTAGQSPFSSPVMVNDDRTGDQSLPVLVATPDAGLFVVWQDQRSGYDNPDIYSSKSLNNGTSFGPNRRVDDSTRFYQTEPAAAVSANGIIYLTWQDNRRSLYDYDIYFSKSYDGGISFTNNSRVDDSNGEIWWQERPSIAVTSGGGLYVAWTDDRLGPGQLRVRGAFSADGGATFSTSQEIVSNGSTSGQTGVVLASNGKRLFAAFMDNVGSVSGASHPYLSISTNGGRSFGAPVRLDGIGGIEAAKSGVAIAPMPGGGVVAAWDDFRNGNWDIYACIVSARGVITTPEFRVDDDSTGAYQTSVSLAADQLGNVYAAWQDERLDACAIRFAYLLAGEAQFNSSIEVAAPSGFDMQRRPSVVTTEPGRVFVAWQEDKAGSYDIYVSGAYFPYLFGLSLVRGWNFVSIPSVGYDYRASTLGLKVGSIVADWNSTTQRYDRTFVVGVSPWFLDFALSASTGYWVFTDTHERLKLKGNIPVAKQYRHIAVPQAGGWVSVGFESLNVTRYASDIPSMFDVAGGIKSVALYDMATGTYKQYIPGVPPTDFALVPGQACWCLSAVGGTLTYTP